VVPERRRLDAELPRRVPVVVPVGDHLAQCVLAGEVALGADGEPPVETDVANTRVVRQEIGDRVGAVVHDDQLGP
jgi:hypothetical protein